MAPAWLSGRRAAIVVAWFAAAAASGCASHSRNLAEIRSSLLEGDVPAAVAQFEDRKRKESDLLYLLERGYMMHLGGRFDESNQAFGAAELRAEELYTKSISRQALALVSSDLSLPYRSTSFELQMVQYYRALNYLELGQPQGALVEARKANASLARYALDPDESGDVRNDPFLHYFTGLLYESEREVNDAAVSFRDASRHYAVSAPALGHGPPSWLGEDFYAAAVHLGLDSDVDSLLAADPALPERAAAHDDDNLVVFFETGFVPYREAVDITLPIFDVEEGAQGDEWVRAGRYVDRYGRDVYRYRRGNVKLDKVLRFAFPALVESPRVVARCELVLPDGTVLPSELALDLAQVARDDFDRRLPGILLKTVARALAKEATRSLAKRTDEGLGWLVNAVNVATEQADTRGWIFLPARIYMLKTRVPAGAQTLKARFLDGRGGLVEEWDVSIEARPGHTRFVSLRCFR